ncbi:MAG: TIGR03560 family F420-dependent LLM class oxidoreductase [Acidimicrobiales bacterium]
MQLRAFTEPQLGASFDEQLALACTAEEHGYDAFFRSDHLLTFAGEGLPGPTESWMTLAAIGRETQRIRLGTLVTSITFRHPGMLAIAVAQADAMSGGRVELGIGAGWFEQEHKAYAVPFPPLGTRFQQLEEQLEILTRFWTAPPGDRVAFEGSEYTVDQSPALPKPVQQPHPPIIIGGGGPSRTPRLAARYADEFNVPPTGHSPEQAKEMIDRVKGACEAIDRDPNSLVYSAAMAVCCGTSEAEAAQRAARIGRPLDQLRGDAAAGTVEEVAARLRSYDEIGVSRVYLQFLDIADLDHVALVGSEVGPLVG